MILRTVVGRTTNNRSRITVNLGKKSTLAFRYIPFNYIVFDLIFIIIMLLYYITLDLEHDPHF